MLPTLWTTEGRLYGQVFQAHHESKLVQVFSLKILRKSDKEWQSFQIESPSSQWTLRVHGQNPGSSILFPVLPDGPCRNLPFKLFIVSRIDIWIASSVSRELKMERTPAHELGLLKCGVWGRKRTRKKVQLVKGRREGLFLNPVFAGARGKKKRNNNSHQFSTVRTCNTLII